jgi:hypothetical protein
VVRRSGFPYDGAQRNPLNKAFDVEIRKVICSTNAIESINSRLRRVGQAALKLVLEPIFEADCAPRGAVSGAPGEVKRLAGLLSQQGL